MMADQAKFAAGRWQPHPGQQAFLESGARVRVLACGRRWGKTDVCAAAMVHELMGVGNKECLFIAPTLDQARILFDRTLDLAVAAGLPPDSIRRSPHPTASFGHHRVQARSGHVGRSLRGRGATHLILDEAAFLPESLVTEVAMPMLAATNGRLVMISTPHGRNHFYRFFAMGQRGEHGIWSRQAPSAESPLVSPSYLELQRCLISERAYRVEYGAEFLEGAGQIFRSDAVARCLAPVGAMPPDRVSAIGIDWARWSDYTALTALAGTRESATLVTLDRFQGLSWADCLDRIGEVIRRFPRAQVHCDATGLGDPMLEMLQRQHPDRRITGTVFTAARKQELIERLAWTIERAQISLPPHPDLLRELEHFELRTGAHGRVKMEAASGFHDDLVISLALGLEALPVTYTGGLRLAGDRC